MVAIKRTFAVLTCVILACAAARGADSDYFAGISAPAKTVVLSARMDGPISRIFVEEGDRVTVDQPLVQFEDKLLKLSAERARLAAEDKSSIKSAELRVDYTRKELERNEKLFEKKNISESEVAEARTQAALAEASLGAAIVQLETNKVDYQLRLVMLDYSVVKSPLAGVVSHRLVEEGESARNLQPLIEIAKVDEIKVKINLPESLIGQVNVGQSAEVKFPALGADTFAGKVSKVSPTVDARSATFQVEVMVDNKDGRIRPGLSASARFALSGNASAQPEKKVKP